MGVLNNLQATREELEHVISLRLQFTITLLILEEQLNYLLMAFNSLWQLYWVP